MGGNYTFVASAGQNSSYMPYLYWLELDGSFPVEENIPLSSINVVEIDPSVGGAVEASLNGNDELGMDLNGGLFYTNDTLYVYAGSPLSKADNTLASYNLAAAGWKNISVSGGNYNYGNRSYGSAVSVPDSGLSFFLGGDVPDLPGLLRLNTANPANLSWTNQTLNNGSYGTAVPDLVGSSLVYVPAGLQGVLIAFGGSNVRSAYLQTIFHRSAADICLRRVLQRLNIAMLAYPTIRI